MKSRTAIVLIILALLVIISYTTSKAVSIDVSNKIAVIPITGTIMPADAATAFYQKAVSSSTLVEFIDAASKNNAVKGIILEINSPGGTVVASKEVAEAVKRSQKPVIALIKDIGASGAYWIASAADVIVADPLSITGSIGVTASYLEFSRLFEEYGVTYTPVKSGPYKDIGSPFKELSPQERILLEKKIGIIHQAFVQEVAKNRNLSEGQVREMATGIYYLGQEAYESGLVDYLGSRDMAINITKQKANIKEAKLITYKKERSIIEVLTSISASSFYHLGRGMADTSISTIQPSPVPLL